MINSVDRTKSFCNTPTEAAPVFFNLPPLFIYLKRLICSPSPFNDPILSQHGSNTQGLSLHSANIWHADKREVVTVSFKK